MSEILVGSIHHAAESAGLSEFFIGAIVIAIVGNAAEHWVAVLVARKDQMDLAVNIAIGSSAQIALFVIPVLILVSFVLGPGPMPFVLNGFELAAILFAVMIANQVTQEGESTWHEGVLLLAVYGVLHHHLRLRLSARRPRLVPATVEPARAPRPRRRARARRPRRRRPRRRAPRWWRSGVVRHLEGLDQLVARMLVDRRLVGDEHPVRALVVLHVEDLGVDVRRVVDDDHDLGLGVEVRPRSVDEVLELEAARVGHSGGFYHPRSRSWRATSASTSSGSLPIRTRRSLRATTWSRTSAINAGSALGRASEASSASTSTGGCPRAHATLVARLEHLADLVVANGARDGRRRLSSRLVVERQRTAPDLGVGLVGQGERDHRDDRRADHDDESTTQNASCTDVECRSMWKRVKRRTFAPRRPGRLPGAMGAGPRDRDRARRRHRARGLRAGWKVTNRCASGTLPRS